MAFKCPEPGCEEILIGPLEPPMVFNGSEFKCKNGHSRFIDPEGRVFKFEGTKGMVETEEVLEEIDEAV